MRWAWGRMQRLENRLLIAFGLLALCIVGLLGMGVRAYNELLAAQSWQTHTHAVIANVNQLETALDEDRGLLYCGLTGNPSGLPPGERSARLRRARLDIQEQVRDNAIQADRLASFDHLMQEWQRNVIEPLRASCAAAHSSAGLALRPRDLSTLAAASRQYRERVHELLADMARDERSLLAQREERASSARLAANRTFGAAAFCTLVLAVASLVMLRKSVKELRASERRLRTMLARLPDGVLAFDEEGRIAWLNAAAEAMLGADLERARGEPIARYIPALDEALQRGDDLAAWLDKRRVLDAHRADGQSFPLELSANALVLEAQPLMVCIARDLTEQQSIDRMKREFVSMVSHELRTPLTGLRGSISLLAEGGMGDLPPNIRQMVQIADQSSERLVTLVNDILDLERTDAGQLSIHLRPVDLAKAARKTVAGLQGLARKHGVNLELAHAPARALTVVADTDRLGQVLANLVSNAIKFSPARGTVSLRVTNGHGAGRVEVRDEGPGVPPDFREHVFERFAQADSTDTRQREGSGLGLSISKALVERMDGRIGFDSPAPGQARGSLFWIELRLHDEP